MAAQRDYYEVLGVARDADAQTIKDAFRELALRYHPDRSKEEGAEERFKEIAEAYAVLSNPEKRAAYDARGFAGVPGMGPEDFFGGVDLEDLFADLGAGFAGFGGGGLFDRLFGHRRRGGPPRGADVELFLQVPLEMVASGGTQRVTVDHPRRCPDCAGSGARAGTEPRRCEACEGQGQTSHVREEGNVRVQTFTTCQGCGGRGSFIDEPCERCHGRGEVAESETLSVTIPVGVGEGMVLRVPGKGRPPSESGGVAGDLLVVVRSLPDPEFERRGPHLWHWEEVDPSDAVLGASLRVPTLGGHARLEIPAGTQPGTVLRLKGKGLPTFGGAAHGDLHVVLQVRIPSNVSRAEKRLWKQLRELGQERGNE